MLIPATSVRRRWAPPAVPGPPRCRPRLALLLPPVAARQVRPSLHQALFPQPAVGLETGFSPGLRLTSAEVLEPEAEVRRGLGRLGIQGDTAVGCAGSCSRAPPSPPAPARPGEGL